MHVTDAGTSSDHKVCIRSEQELRGGIKLDMIEDILMWPILPMGVCSSVLKVLALLSQKCDTGLPRHYLPSSHRALIN